MVGERFPVYRLVPLTEEHAGPAREIFNRHVADGFAAYPEEPVSESFIIELARSAIGDSALAAVGEDSALLGFGFLRPYSPATAFSHTAVTTIFLSPEWTGRGIGAAILRLMVDGAGRKGITRVLAHISSRNPRSIAFHRRHGFVECGRFPGVGRKRGEDFDVVWMVNLL
ncbi:GNAT family N-acetyltransferase [Candidatus Bipolaricaulota bacterium]